MNKTGGISPSDPNRQNIQSEGEKKTVGKQGEKGVERVEGVNPPFVPGKEPRDTTDLENRKAEDLTESDYESGSDYDTPEADSSEGEGVVSANEKWSDEDVKVSEDEEKDEGNLIGAEGDPSGVGVSDEERDVPSGGGILGMVNKAAGWVVGKILPEGQGGDSETEGEASKIEQEMAKEAERSQLEEAENEKEIKAQKKGNGEEGKRKVERKKEEGDIFAGEGEEGTMFGDLFGEIYRGEGEEKKEEGVKGEVEEGGQEEKKEEGWLAWGKGQFNAVKSFWDNIGKKAEEVKGKNGVIGKGVERPEGEQEVVVEKTGGVKVEKDWKYKEPQVGGEEYRKDLELYTKKLREFKEKLEVKNVKKEVKGVKEEEASGLGVEAFVKIYEEAVEKMADGEARKAMEGCLRRVKKASENKEAVVLSRAEMEVFLGATDGAFKKAMEGVKGARARFINEYGNLMKMGVLVMELGGYSEKLSKNAIDESMRPQIKVLRGFDIRSREIKLQGEDGKYTEIGVAVKFIMLGVVLSMQKEFGCFDEDVYRILMARNEDLRKADELMDRFCGDGIKKEVREFYKSAQESERENWIVRMAKEALGKFGSDTKKVEVNLVRVEEIDLGGEENPGWKAIDRVNEGFGDYYAKAASVKLGWELGDLEKVNKKIEPGDVDKVVERIMSSREQVRTFKDIIGVMKRDVSITQKVMEVRDIAGSWMWGFGDWIRESRVARFLRVTGLIDRPKCMKMPVTWMEWLKNKAMNFVVEGALMGLLSKDWRVALLSGTLFQGKLKQSAVLAIPLAIVGGILGVTAVGLLGGVVVAGGWIGIVGLMAGAGLFGLIGVGLMAIFGERIRRWVWMTPEEMLKVHVANNIAAGAAEEAIKRKENYAQFQVVQQVVEEIRDVVRYDYINVNVSSFKELDEKTKEINSEKKRQEMVRMKDKLVEEVEMMRRLEVILTARKAEDLDFIKDEKMRGRILAGRYYDLADDVKNKVRIVLTQKKISKSPKE